MTSATYASPPSSSPREWTDQITPFNIKTIKSTLLDPEEPQPFLPQNYEWFASAVPAYAIFPPGIPLTASELNAYYPHHIRWVDVMLRLANNGYKGYDLVRIQSFFRGISTPPLAKKQANQYQRDMLKKTVPTFSTVPGAWEGVPDSNLSTADLDPGPILSNRLNGRFTAPTFNELVRGLTAVPEGDSARELTKCLVWWLQNRDTFTPRLEFNVLHVPWLVRALRISLPPYGSRNLDQEALEEWKITESLPSTNIENEKCADTKQKNTTLPPTIPRSRLEVDLQNETVTLKLNLQLRNILLYPYMSMRNMATAGVTALLLNEPEESPTPTIPSPQTPSSARTLSAEPSSTRPLSREPSHPFQTPIKTAPPQTLSVEEALRGYHIPKRRHYPHISQLESPNTQSLRKKMARDAYHRRETQELNGSPLPRSAKVEGNGEGSSTPKRGYEKYAPGTPSPLRMANLEGVEDGYLRSPEESPCKRLKRDG
ncbi:hypothetical protein DM02DRAFT_655801 [Periconia macrospinosa]|uniref:Uncharacterized protein n=1 Tax=Periconia macrospinosa TaxID=97972 RepID=A0A2V1DP89_9PLEO|nr:hypothetical protein DM02DRAFT_655801 [Periconia macrospinosa]